MTATTLSHMLERLRAQLSDQHGAEYSLLVDLNARLERQDMHLIGELTAVLEGQEQRRAEVHRLLTVLASRVGLLPPAAAIPLAALPGDATAPMPKVLEDERARQAAANGHYETSPAGLQ